MYLETPMNSLGALFETIDEKTGDVWGSCDEGGIQSLGVSVKKGSGMYLQKYNVLENIGLVNCFIHEYIFQTAVKLIIYI